MSLSNSEELPLRKSITANKSTAPPKLYKKKKIKKRRKVRSNVKPTHHADPQSLIQDFLSTQAKEYFSLSAHEAKEACNRTFRSFVHIKNIIGQQQNVYNLKNYSQAPSQADKYLIMCRLARKNRMHALRFSSKQQRKTVKCYMHKQDADHKREVILLDEHEARAMEKRQEMLAEVDRFLVDVLKNNPEGGVDPIAREIITLCKLNNLNQRQLNSDIQRYLRDKSDNLFEAHQQQMDKSSELETRYCQLIIKKNLMVAFDERPLDFLNYFRKIDIQEQSIEDNDPIKLLDSSQQFKKYLKLMKPNQNKSEKDQLKTACGACFSDCNETYNPLVRCPECGIRVHRLCHNLRGKCQKCKYTRKTTEEKSNKPYCFICLREKQHGISIQTIKSEEQQHYAHTFCLLISKLWRVRDNQVIYHMDHLNTMEQPCHLCNRKGGVCLKAEGQLYFHGFCAYLQGYSMSISSNDTISVSGSSDSKRIALQRCFRINFQKTIYRKTEEILEIIQSQ